jgi:hypothetical protein
MFFQKRSLTYLGTIMIKVSLKEPKDYIRFFSFFTNFFFLQQAKLIKKNPNNLNKDNSYGGDDFSHA